MPGLRAADHRSAERHIVRGEPSRVEHGQLPIGAAAQSRADEDLAERGMDPTGLKLPAADGHVELAAVQGLRAVIHNNNRLSKDPRLQLLLAGCVGSNRVHMSAWCEPRPLDERTA